MNLQEELLKLLLELKEKNQTLKVVWNTGGDQTILNFLVDGKYMSSNPNPIFEKLRDFLVIKFQLPNAGEYYNEGKAEIKLPEYDNNDTTILITFDEFAYDSEMDFRTNILNEEMRLLPSKETKYLLTILNQPSLNFGGSISFRNNERQKYFRISYNYLEIQKHQNTVDLIHQYILNFILETYKGVTHSIELSFGGKMNQAEINFDEFYVIKNYADKDQQNVTLPLFYE